MDIREVRLLRLRMLLAEDGGKLAALAKRLGKSSSQISQWLGRHRTITEDSARDIERKARKSPGWLDQPDFATPAAPSSDQQVRPSLEQALPVVLGAVAKLTPGQWRMVRARLDDLPEQPSALPGVLADVAPVLGLAPSVVSALLARQAQFETLDLQPARTDPKR